MDANFIVLISFISFLSLLGYLKVHRLLLNKINDYSKEIENKINIAKQNLEKIQKELSDSEQKLKDMNKLSLEIINSAKQQSELIKIESEKQINQLIERKVNGALNQIENLKKEAYKNIANELSEMSIFVSKNLITEHITEKDHQKHSEELNSIINSI